MRAELAKALKNARATGSTGSIFKVGSAARIAAKSTWHRNMERALNRREGYITAQTPGIHKPKARKLQHGDPMIRAAARASLKKRGY